MIRSIACAVLALLLPAARGWSAELKPERVDGAPLGPVHYYSPPIGKVDGLVIMISDRRGWDDDASAMAKHLADSGEAVVGLELPVYRAALARDANDCTLVNRDLQVIARDAERDLPFDQYRPPVILGLGAGSGIAYAAIGQVLPNTFAGGIGLRFDPVIDVGHRLCLPLAPGQPPAAEGGQNPPSADGRPDGPVRYAPVTDHDTPFLFTPSEPFAATGGGLDDFLAAMKQAHLIAGDKDDIATVDDAIGQIARIGQRESSVDGLPLVEMPPAGDRAGRHTLVIFYSGDGGWRDIDMKIGGYLADHGYLVVGIDSLRYFWRTKEPGQMAADLDRLIRHYRPRSPGDGVILVGYSFGADVLPFMVNRMAADTRAEVRLVALLGIADRASFKIRLEGILGAPNTDGPLTSPELVKLRDIPILCVYGANETDSVCTSKELTGNIDRARLHGGHHFGGDYRDAANLILAADRPRVSEMKGP
jgi:type IV secretory pathway VirJ component